MSVCCARCAQVVDGVIAIANVIYLCVVLNLLGLRLLRCLLGLRLCKGVSARAGGLVQRTVVLNDELQDGVGAQCLDGEGLGGVAFCTRSIRVGCGLTWRGTGEYGHLRRVRFGHLDLELDRWVPVLDDGYLLMLKVAAWVGG